MKRLGQEFADKIKRALLKIGTTENTQSLMEFLEEEGGIQGFEEVRESDYNSIREAYDLIRTP